MIFLSDIQLTQFARGKDKKPRKKRNWSGVGTNALVGAATGGALGDYGVGAIRPSSSRLRRVALATGLVGGGLAAAVSKYRNNNRNS